MNIIEKHYISILCTIRVHEDFNSEINSNSRELYNRSIFNNIKAFQNLFVFWSIQILS